MIRQQNVRIENPTQEHSKLRGLVGYIRWDSDVGARLNDMPRDVSVNFTHLDRYEQPHRIIIGVHELSPMGEASDYSLEDGAVVTAQPNLDPVGDSEIETAETGVKPVKLLLSIATAIQNIEDAKAELLRKATVCDQCLVLLEESYEQATAHSHND